VALVLRGDLRPRDEPVAWGDDGDDSSSGQGSAAWPRSPASTVISLSPPPPVTAVPSPYDGLITHGSPPPLSVSLTMVPPELYSDRAASDFFDPLEDAVWVLLHDEGTPDEQFFSMELNGTRSVVCFRSQAAADRCVSNLEARVGARPAARQLLLEEVIEAAMHAGTELTQLDETDMPAAGGGEGACGAASGGEITMPMPDVYLVDEVEEVEDVIEGEDDRPLGGDGEGASAGAWGRLELRQGTDARPGAASDCPRAARRAHPRARLESIYASADAGESGDQVLFDQMIREYTAGDADAADTGL
jgi:hypothetical protein